MITSKKYIVQSGDTLTSIAAKFGLSSWQFIYNHIENKALFAKNESPDNLQIGDELMIPPSPIDLLEYRIVRLQKLKNETSKMYDQLIGEMNLEFRKTQQFAQNIDAIGALAQLGIGYAKIAKGGIDAMALTGKELAKANRELTKSVLTNGPKFAVEQTIQASSILEVSAGEGWGTAVPKILVQSWFDMTSPSYWAQRFTGFNLKDEHLKTITNLNRQKTQSLQNLSRQIDLAKAKLIQLRNL